MFDIFCHKITFVFENVQIDVNDLLDVIAEKPDIKIPLSKKQQVQLLLDLFEARKKNHVTMPKKSVHEEDKIL